MKIVKKTLVHVLPVGRQLTYSEFETLLGRVEFSINSRPLALAAVSNTSQQEDMMQPLTPNQLLLGRNTAEVPPMEYDVSNKFCARVAYMCRMCTLSGGLDGLRRSCQHSFHARSGRASRGT